MKRADLHVHSTASDGKLTPKEIVELADKNSIDYIAITDHNTIDGVELGVKEGKKIGVKVIPGIELSTRYKGKQVHLLGYFVKDKKAYKNELLSEALYWIRKKRLEKLKDLFSGELNIKKGAKRLEVSEGIKLLRMFKAKIFIAHPVKLKQDELNEILKLGVDGIEAIHPRHSSEDIERFINLAKEKNIKYSAGSDFHNIDKKNLKHGIIGEIYIKVEDISEIL